MGKIIASIEGPFTCNKLLSAQNPSKNELTTNVTAEIIFILQSFLPEARFIVLDHYIKKLLSLAKEKQNSKYALFALQITLNLLQGSHLESILGHKEDKQKSDKQKIELIYLALLSDETLNDLIKRGVKINDQSLETEAQRSEDILKNTYSMAELFLPGLLNSLSEENRIRYNTLHAVILGNLALNLQKYADHDKNNALQLLREARKFSQESLRLFYENANNDRVSIARGKQIHIIILIRLAPFVLQAGEINELKDVEREYTEIANSGIRQELIENRWFVVAHVLVPTLYYLRLGIAHLENNSSAMTNFIIDLIKERDSTRILYEKVFLSSLLARAYYYLSFLAADINEQIKHVDQAIKMAQEMSQEFEGIFSEKPRRAYFYEMFNDSSRDSSNLILIASQARQLDLLRPANAKEELNYLKSQAETIRRAILKDAGRSGLDDLETKLIDDVLRLDI